MSRPGNASPAIASLDSSTGRALWSAPRQARPDEDPRLDYFRLPVVASYSWVLAVFVAALALFHAVLIWVWPLGRVGWKRLDYVWLLFRMIGVLSGVQQELRGGPPARGRGVRALRGCVHRRSHRRRGLPGDLQDARPLRACAWFRAAKQRVAGGLPAGRPLTLELLGGDPVPLGAEFSIVAGLEDAVARYNRAQDTLERLTNEADQTEAEATLGVVGPFLLAIALALRITKVTGELQLERRG